MEKLQSALQKARKTRDSSAPAPRPQGGIGARMPGRQPQATTELWDQIALTKLDPKYLVSHRVLTADVTKKDSSSFDLLRTKIQLQMEKNDWKRLAITSPKKSSGKTTICANLTYALSRQESKRTILFDFDMRRPAIAKMLGLTPKRSTADLLRGQVDFAEQAIRIGPNVAVSCNPSSSPSPSDLFLDPRTLSRLNEIENEYDPDIVIFDLPPLHAGDDATAFFPNVDCVLLIAESEKCTIQQIDTAEREIAEHTNFMGVVLNKCRYPEEQEGYGYGYN